MSRRTQRSRRLAVAAIVVALITCAGVVGCVEDRIGSADDNVRPIPSGPTTFPLDIGPTVTASEPPPPISGGTLAISPAGDVIVAADSARDVVHVVDAVEREKKATIVLEDGDEPGRVVVDGAGRVHVVLRRGGAVATFELETDVPVSRTPVCPAPRGIDLDPEAGALYVACEGGQLIRLDASTLESTKTVTLEPGLRDVVVNDIHIYVSRFREAEVLALDREEHTLEQRLRPPAVELDSVQPDGSTEGVRFEPAVAWRMRPNPDGGVYVVHQRARVGDVSVQEGGYASSSGCADGIVHAAVTPLKPGQTSPGAEPLAFTVLPVDIAIDHARRSAWLVRTGNSLSVRGTSETAARVDLDRHDGANCQFGDPAFGSGVTLVPVAAEVLSDHTVVVQSWEPSSLHFMADGGEGRVVALSDESVADTGHQIFHMDSGGGIACASCHPEGRDDARAWHFDDIGIRRTQTLAGGLAETAPFHWSGDMADLDQIMSEVFVERMGGGVPNEAQSAAIAAWLETIPAPNAAPLVADVAAVRRGHELFYDPEVGCATCHAGDAFTDNRTVSVGTGAEFQVPRLVGIAQRAPYMHDGCAPTLTDRFLDTRCGGGDQHGKTSHLTPAQIDDLVAFLETL